MTWNVPGVAIIARYCFPSTLYAANGGITTQSTADHVAAQVGFAESGNRLLSAGGPFSLKPVYQAQAAS
jgi:hypothetical protein